MISVTDLEYKTIKNILKEHIKKGRVLAFGSRFKWINKDYSDLDIAIDTGEKLQVSDIFALKNAFEESSLPYTVDIIDYNNISDSFKSIIDGGNEIIYETGEWQEVSLGEALYFNPKEQLAKGKIYKKISMDCLSSKKRQIERYETNTFNGGSKFRNGDILFARITPCLENGKISQVSILGKNEIAFGSTEFIVLREKENITLNNFIYYLFTSKDIKDIAIKSMSGTSGRQRVQEDILKNLKIKLPPLPVQKRIADILSSLDNKIELNNKINKTLENIAEALFKEWFINFNFPNSEGKPYKDSGGKMTESELGDIPEGWKMYNLNDICNINSGYSYSSKDLNISNNAMITIKNFDRNGGFRLDGFKEIIISDKVKNIHYANLHDVLVAHTDITQKADIIGNPILLLSKGKYDNLIISMDLVKVTSNTKDISNAVIYNILKNINFKNHCLGYSSGTTVLHLSKKAIPSYRIALPDFELLKIISDILNPIYNKISVIVEENQKLAGIRDLLLPKLMSGEIKV